MGLIPWVFGLFKLADIIRRALSIHSLFGCVFVQIIGGFRQFADLDQYPFPVALAYFRLRPSNYADTDAWHESCISNTEAKIISTGD